MERSEHEAHLHRLTEHIRDAVWTYNPASGRVFYSNPAFAKVWGLAPEILAGDGEAWLTAVAPAHRDRVAACIEGLRMGAPFDDEFQLNPPEGDERWIRCRCFPVTDAEGSATSVVAVAEDITIRRRAEILYSRLEREIHHAAEEERRNIARDLHDSLGSMLSAIQLRLEVLRSDVSKGHLPGAEEVAAIAALAKQAVSESRSLTRGLSPVGADPYDLNAALEGLVRDTRKFSPVTIRLHLPDPVRIDSQQAASQLFRIAQEAITNAVKHSDGNRIDVGFTCAKGRIILTVEDNGRGFDPPDSGVTDGPSTGRGLGIMKYRATDIGAELQLDRCENGTGTRLACVLPAHLVVSRET